MKDTLEPEKSRPEPKKAKLPRKITPAYLENSGKYYLEKFPASIAHFRLVMTRKIRKSCLAHPDQNMAEAQRHLEEVIQKFIRAGFLNDEALSQGLMYSLTQRGWSMRKIKMWMRQKGLPAPLIEEAAESTGADHTDLGAAARWVRKKRLGAFATTEPKPDKWLASLGRAGFDYETARRSLALSKEEIEDLLSG